MIDKDILRNLKIFGYHKASMIDYPNQITSILFTKYCNMSCSYCHQYKTMLETEPLNKEQLEYVINDSINNLSTAITITGGEPTLYGRELISLLKHYRSNTSKKLKLDTNGTMPEVLKEIIDNKLVDFIAMDIKADFNCYNKLGYNRRPDNLYKSYNLICNSNIDYQFRCTVNDNFNNIDYKFISDYVPDIKLQKYSQM
ncbi:MAG TPA: anaerobic ribonucleoside-triphosphate reductase activating protein [Bacteroidales bacterium]|nr:anaerobic ribonucleoside-triphosphate reductase activating protein [Bacteroidales bacterium]